MLPVITDSSIVVVSTSVRLDASTFEKSGLLRWSSPDIRSSISLRSSRLEVRHQRRALALDRAARIEKELLLLADVGLARAIHQHVADPVEDRAERRRQARHGEVPALAQDPVDFAHGWRPADASVEGGSRSYEHASLPSSCEFATRRVRRGSTRLPTPVARNPTPVNHWATTLRTQSREVTVARRSGGANAFRGPGDGGRTRSAQAFSTRLYDTGKGVLNSCANSDTCSSSSSQRKSASAGSSRPAAGCAQPLAVALPQLGHLPRHAARRGPAASGDLASRRSSAFR